MGVQRQLRASAEPYVPVADRLLAELAPVAGRRKRLTSSLSNPDIAVEQVNAICNSCPEAFPRTTRTSNENADTEEGHIHQLKHENRDQLFHDGEADPQILRRRMAQCKQEDA